MKGQGTIVATGAIGYPPGLAAVGAQIGAEKVMTMTSTYDHRIIQGAESGQFLQVVEEYLQGEHDFYEQVFADLGAQVGAVPERASPRRRAAARGRAADRQHAVAAEAPPERAAAAGRAGGDLADQGAPHARPPRRASSTRSAPSPRATRRSTPSRSA